jgi:hypothetical protein
MSGRMSGLSTAPSAAPASRATTASRLNVASTAEILYSVQDEMPDTAKLEISAARTSQPHLPDPMRSSSELETSSRVSSRFQRRLPGGRHDLIFKVAFGSHAAAARALRRSKMTIWRWRHDRLPLPKWVADVLDTLVQRKVEQAHEAQTQLRYFRQLPPRPPRRLTGCCAGYTPNR